MTIIFKNIYFQLINEKIREVKTFLSDLRGRKVNKDFHDRIIVPREEVLLKLDNLLPLDQQQWVLLQRENFKGDLEAFDQLTKKKLTIRLKTDGRYHVIGENNISIGISMSKEELDSIEIENDYVRFRQDNGKWHSKRIC